MENTILPLTKVARAKYVRDFTRKINNSDSFADIFAAKRPKKQGVKKRRKIEPRPTVRLQKKDINQEYVVQRMRFLKQSIEIVNQAVNSQPRTKMATVSFSQSKFEQFKNKSFEIERQKLEEMYKVEMQNLNVSMEPVNRSEAPDQAKSPVPKPHPDQLEHTEDSIPSAAEFLINNSIPLEDLQQGDECAPEHPKVEFQETSEFAENTRKDLELVPIEPTDQLIQDDPQEKAIQLCQNQLQNINLNSNHCNALVPRPTNNITSRRICHRTKRFKRHSMKPMKPICAHCHDLITEVAYFSGTQQLCFECADRHYERVSRARYRDKPMPYKEFKNIGGDTIYTNKNKNL